MELLTWMPNDSDETPVVCGFVWSLPDEDDRREDGAPPSRYREEIPVVVEGEIEFVDGQHVIRKLTVEAKPGAAVTANVLRQIPIQRLIRDALADADVLQALSVDPDIARKGPTDEALQAVATIYRSAVAVGDPPTKSVAELLDLAGSTAGRWVMKARDAGYLGETTKGKAGA